MNLGTVAAAVSSSLRAVYELVYPPVCLACSTPLNEGGERICTDCLHSLKKVTPDDLLYKEMYARHVADGTLTGLVSAFHFEKDGTLQGLIHQLKYNEMTRIGVELGKQVGALLRSSIIDAAKMTIIPIPLHPVKKRERGYNQSEFIAQGIAEVTGGATNASLLARVKNTRTQTKLNRDERTENMKDAFTILRRFRHKVSGSSFILVDDVITTGATIRECAHVLKEQGATRVVAASVALADHALDLALDVNDVSA